MSTRQEDLCQSCRQLWRATLNLMKAHLCAPGPAQRVMLARRIARNVRTLALESPSFAPASRDAFSRLAHQWAQRAGWR